MAYLTDAQVKRIWQVYTSIPKPTYSLVAKLTGHSSGTISKYVKLCQQALEAQEKERNSVTNAVDAVVNSQMATKSDLDKAVELLLKEYRKKNLE